MNRRALHYAAMVSLGGFLFGFDASVISGVIGFIVPQFELSDWQLGLVVGAPTLGGVIASMGGAILADVFGRKRILVVLSVLYSVSALASALAPNYEVLVAARFLGGLAFASLGIAPMYIGEIAPRDKRGMLVSVNQLNIVVGFSVAYFANYFLLQAIDSPDAWRWMLGIELIPAGLWFVIMLLVPESPRWLVMQGRLDEARRVLELLKPAARVQATLIEIRRSLATVEEKFLNRLREVFMPAMRLPLLIGLVVAIGQQVTGINAIYFYAPTIFELSGVGTNTAFAQATLIGVINVVVTVIAMLLIDRVGRKPLMMLGLAGVILSTALVGYGFRQASYELSAENAAAMSIEVDAADLQSLVGKRFENDLAFKDGLREALGSQAVREHGAALTQAAAHINSKLVLVGILGFVASFALSLGPVMWCLLSEIFPNRARGPAMAVCGFFNAMSSFFVQFVFPWELSNLGNAMTFFLYSILGIIAFALLFRLLPETRGKSLEELELILVGGRS